MKRVILILCCLTSLSVKAQIYDPAAVAVINNLIANNSLVATPNAPETWYFATWNDEIPRQLTQLHLDYKNMSGAASFAGLTALQELDCSYNRFVELDVSQCNGLQLLYSTNNSLVVLDVSQCTGLKELNCRFNNLTKLDLSQCTGLQWLYCDNNELTELYISQCTGLQWLSCDGNSLVKLDVSQCTGLQWLYCGNNELAELDLSGCSVLQKLFCSYNSFSELKFDQCAELRELFCYNNNLMELDVTQCTKLQELDCRTNNLTELDVHKCAELQWLSCDNNSLVKLDVTQCTELETLRCAFNNLNELDVTQCIELKRLDCTDNNLSELDVTRCTGLLMLFCSRNNLTKLDVSGLIFLGNFNGDYQNIFLTFYESTTGEYTRNISLNQPTFGNNAITYESGNLRSVDNTVAKVNFTVQIGSNSWYILSGTMIFTYPTYAINIDNYAGGSVITSTTSATTGTTITLSIVPDVDYELETISVYKTGEPATNIMLVGTDAVRTFTMPAYDVTVVAMFKEMPPPTYTISIGAFSGGRVTASETSSPTGVTITLSIAPDADYELESISAYRTGMQTTVVELSGTDAARTFTMPAYDVTVAAIFKKTQVTGTEDMSANPLRAWVHSGRLYVTELIVGETLSVYSTVGTLVHHSVATFGEVEIPLKAQGVYIVRSGNYTVKVVFE